MTPKPTLTMTGSPKQIAWAQDIRSKALEALEAKKPNWEAIAEQAPKVLEMLNIENAKWWIDWRTILTDPDGHSLLGALMVVDLPLPEAPKAQAKTQAKPTPTREEQLRWMPEWQRAKMREAWGMADPQTQGEAV